MYTVGKLKEMCKIEENHDEEALAKLNIVDAANSAIKNLVRFRKSQCINSSRKKREMLLFQMLIDQKREMINQF